MRPAIHRIIMKNPETKVVSAGLCLWQHGRIMGRRNDMQATDILMEEHRVIERVLTSLERAAVKLDNGGPVRPGFFIDAAEFVKGFADGCHHKKEEGVLFTALVDAGLPREVGPGRRDAGGTRPGPGVYPGHALRRRAPCGGRDGRPGRRHQECVGLRRAAARAHRQGRPRAVSDGGGDDPPRRFRPHWSSGSRSSSTRRPAKACMRNTWPWPRRSKMKLPIKGA